MANGRMCVNHPTRRALHSCRRCGKPLCDVCANDLGGRFCSPQCADTFQEFQSKVADVPLVRRKRFSLVGCLRTFVLSIILGVIIWVALWQLFGTTDPDQMWVELKKMWRLAF